MERCPWTGKELKTDKGVRSSPTASSGEEDWTPLGFLVSLVTLRPSPEKVLERRKKKYMERLKGRSRGGGEGYS